MLYTTTFDTAKVGPLRIVSDEHYIIRLDFGKEKRPESVKYLTKWCGGGEVREEKTPLLARAEEQLTGYLEGRSRTFDLPLKLYGTTFQRACWEALQAIPYGETRTYQQLACVVGRPKGSRAVGQAIHHNPIGIVIPCHRVIGANGSLTGFAGGLEVKRALLALEQHRD